MTTPFKVKAVYEYNSAHEDDLQFHIGQIITVTEEEDDEWYTGEYVDESGAKQEGMFPRNFVEKYEPTAPPRPVRHQKKKSEAAAVHEEPAAPMPSTPKEAVPEPEAASPKDAKVASPTPAPAVDLPIREEHAPTSAPAPAQPSPKAAEAPVPAPVQAKPKGPPPVSEKPASSSFKDRIAAFNKPAAPPVAPFKPSGIGAGSTGFIKKPFVAPPPSRNAYVPPPREAPTTKVYRREEDPEIREREAENLESAEKAGLAPAASASAEGAEEDEPKPLSLKERMALLQKQQMEQAQRHADAAAKKEKPKRPAKKRMESHESYAEGDAADIPPTLERRDTQETGGRRSIEETHPPKAPQPTRRKSSRGVGPEDGNEADMSGAGDTTEGQEDLTEKEESDEKPRPLTKTPTASTTATEPAREEDIEEEDEDDEEEEEDVDPEVRRKEELRARMAKMSGGMGMAGMFGMMPMPGAAAPPKKKKASVERRPSEYDDEATTPGASAPPVPVMALPGMSAPKTPGREERSSLDVASPSGNEGDEEDEDEPAPRAVPPVPSRGAGAPPPVPAGRPAPPPVPADSRPPPLPPTASEIRSQSEGSESDDELSERPQDPADTPKGEAPPASRAPPPPPVAVPPPAIPTSPRSPGSNRRSYMGDGLPPISPSGAPPPPNKRDSRPPPIPGTAPALPPTQTRPPPPPPPGTLSRQSTADTRPLSPTKAPRHDEEEEEEEVTEYEGDYDTDIASSVPHKDALKSHARESSFDESFSMKSPTAEAPPSVPPPIPSASAPRAPPPVPTQAPPHDKRRSTDMPRAPPPPPPPAKQNTEFDDDYDPYNYTATPTQGIPIPGFAPPPPRPAEEPQAPLPPEPSLAQPPPPQTRAPPPAPPANRSARQSVDAGRAMPTGRRSIDVNRPSIESGFVANDIDLAPQSSWWLQPNSLPPQLQGRRDIFFESDESQNSEHGKTIVTRDVYVLYQDYSQTVITINFDAANPSDAQLEQRHEGPPRTLRQDQLEQSYERFGRQIGETVGSKKDTVVGDGTPQGLIYELLRPFKDALLPVGSRAYGALVYSNLANASTSQNDEIRAGDIISIRNAKFQGKHGPMHAKYSVEVGKPDHVAVVAEWDGTKKKVRAWEQGRENKKVKLESFKLDDLRSGEVKIWRVMPRSWVGWQGQN
ncbi:uncharacterized protein E0L32_007331 [Thyridium curvatum]|uniref:SH3 domain-containing protein n=1 Tax=Thyridium curvatum TaxID=1093900 RepID=A0A507B5A3_9PEZI|nr:uncharacterized protein E0L32_007331 [Thyridium curvatum]TPX12028.1 hypothetical protein E0L32_007331 [Thyridium curvatum]